VALREVTLQVCKGEFVAIVGKSGSGKSTLINLLTGIDSPSAGAIRIASTDVHTLDQEALSRWRGNSVGIVFQFFQLLPSLTVAENVMLPMDFCNTYRPAERRARATDLLAHLGIADQADKLPTALSGGQQQRAAIARALANDPPLIVADEPTGNLDSRTAQEVMAFFARLVETGKTVVMVTHERDLERYFARSVTLVDGVIEARQAARSSC
jgi:putative ABC transport system ATP-binding protein